MKSLWMLIPCTVIFYIYSMKDCTDVVKIGFCRNRSMQTGFSGTLIGWKCWQTTPEQQLWSLFEKSDIFEFLTGQTDTVPQFENYFTFGATPKVNIDIQRIAQNLHPIPHTNNQGPIYIKNLQWKFTSVQNKLEYFPLKTFSAVPSIVNEFY